MFLNLIKKSLSMVTALTLGAAVVTASMVSAADDDMLKNIVITPGDRTSEANMWKNGGTVKDEGGKFRFADGTTKIEYQLPINSNAKAKLESGEIDGVTIIVVVRQNFFINGKPDNGEEKTLATAIGPSHPTSRLSFDISEDVKNGASSYQIVIGDQTTNDGHGGCIYSLALVYQKLVAETVTMAEADEKGKPVQFIATSLEEQRYLLEGGGQEKEAERFRFMDGASTVTYRLPYDSSKDAEVGLVLAANYIVWVSTDNKTWGDPVANNPTGLDADGNKLEAATQSLYGMKRLNLTELGHKGADTDFIYIKIGCQNTRFGNGGCMYGLKMDYDGNLFNALAFVDGVNQNNRGDGLEVATALEPATPKSNMVIYVIIGVGALALTGGALAQFISAQKKNK